MVLATMALSTSEEDSLESRMSSWEWTLAILSVIALAERVLYINFSARFSTVQKKEKILKIQKAFFIAWKFIFSHFLLAK